MGDFVLTRLSSYTLLIRFALSCNIMFYLSLTRVLFETKCYFVWTFRFSKIGIKKVVLINNFYFLIIIKWCLIHSLEIFKNLVCVHISFEVYFSIMQWKYSFCTIYLIKTSQYSNKIIDIKQWKMSRNYSSNKIYKINIPRMKTD